MPWHKKNVMISVTWKLTGKLRETNMHKWYYSVHFWRKVNNVRGFSRETLIALVANIES